MTHDPLEQVTRLLRDASAEEVGDVEALPAHRDEAIARIASAIAARSRVSLRRRAMGVLAAAAGVLVVAGGARALAQRGPSGAAASPATLAARGPAEPAHDLGRVDGSGVTVLREGGAEEASGGARIAEGAVLRIAAGAEARLSFESGTQVTLGSGARVRLVEQRRQKRFALEEGSLSAKVAKLGPDERFVVATGDAEIEVRGTAFRIALAVPDPSCHVATTTRLAVTEGVVVVRHAGSEERVAAGESWPRGCDGHSAEAARPVEELPTLSARGSKTSHAGTRPTAPGGPGGPDHVRADLEAPAGPRSQLSEQNDAFDAAMKDKREGRTLVAIAKLERMLDRWPDGPLAESAAAERMRVLAAGDPARSRQAARDYLARWPRGFARVEADAIARRP